ATAVLTNGRITAINITGGTGYTSAPTVIIAPPLTGLTLSGGGNVTLPLSNDNVTGSANVNLSGFANVAGTPTQSMGTLTLGSSTSLGLTDSGQTVRLIAGTIRGTVPLSFTNPITLNNSQITFAGSNPIEFGGPLAPATGHASVTNGSIDNLILDYGGFGYSTVPVVTVVVSGGGGSNFTA